MTKNILMILTSHKMLGTTGRPTGFWLEELAAPYYEFVNRGYDVDLASIQGGDAPIDPHSLESLVPAAQAFLADTTAMGKVHTTLAIRDLYDVHADYAAYYVVGGHGIVWDAPDDDALQKMLGRAFDERKVVAAVCHGPAALVNVRTQDGSLLVQGRLVNSFTDEEERQLGLDAVVPFLLESKLRELGALFEKAPPGTECVAQDGYLVTGQNPASAAGVARKVIELLTPELVSAR